MSEPRAEVVSAHETIRVTRDGAVATIELHRPQSLNAITLTLAREVHEVLLELADDREVGAIVLTGAGRGFSSGFDLRSDEVPRTASGRPDTGGGLREVFNPLVLQLRRQPQPVIAALNGIAAGIGCSYALACDLVVAARSASLLLAFVNVGLVPDGGSSLLVTARAGLGRALEMSLLGERVDAETAHAWGLVNRVVDDEQLLPATMELARKVAAGPPQAHAAIKDLLNATFLDLLERQLAREADVQAVRTESDEAGEAILAFLEKRAARFR